MRGLRELCLATTTIVLIAAGSALPLRSAPLTDAEIDAAVPMPEAADLLPPTADDLNLPTTGEPSTAFEGENGSSAPTVAMPAAAEPAAAEPAAPTATVSAAPAAPSIEQQVAERLHDLLTAKVDRIIDRRIKAAVDAFYSARGYAPIWLESGSENQRAKAAATYLSNVDADGLDPGDYPLPSFANPDPAALAEAELKFTATVLTYARHALLGRVHYSRVSADVIYDQQAPDPAGILGNLAAADSIAEALDGFNPSQPGYRALKAKLAELRGRSGERANRIAGGPQLKVGMDDPRVPALRERLGVNGSDTVYDKALADAVKAFQRQHGLPATGALTSATVDAINGGVRHDREVNIIIANMERWRWMPRDLGKAYVIVNIPDYTLKVVDQGKMVWTTRIVAGKPGEKATPLLSETMKYITVNPTWNVPPSIINNEYLPALAQDPTVLDRMGLKLVHDRDGSVHIFQPPGDGNALGHLRFNFPNKFLVYQHDTPDKYLFASDKRAFSHGCMRVQYPDKYAEVLLAISNPKDGYTAERIRRMYGSTERDIQLTTPIPVHLTYQTAFVDEAGRLQFREDVYGRDSRLMAVLKSEDRRVADTPVERSERHASAAAPRRQVVSRAPYQPAQGQSPPPFFFGWFR